MGPSPASSHSIRRAAARVLGTRALSLEKLATELAGEGLELAPDAESRVADAVLDDGRFWDLDDDRVISVESMLDGITWTVAVPEVLPDDDCVPAEPDLCLLAWWAIEHPIPVTASAAGVLERVDLDDRTDAFVGPPGWLDNARGGHVAVTSRDSRVSVAAVDTVPTPDPAQVVAIQQAFTAAARHDELSDDLVGVETRVDLLSATLERLLWHALLADRDAFVTSTIAPVDALLATAGFERRNSLVVPVGFDWDALDRVHRRRRLAAAYELTEQEVDMAELVIGASFAVIAGDPDPLGPPDEEHKAALLFSVFFDDPNVCRAFVGRHDEAGTADEDIAAFARRLLDHFDDDVVNAGLRWLLARSLDRTGEPLGAEAELEQVVASADENILAFRALAAFRADRGDARAALALLRRAGLDVDDVDDDDLDTYDELLDEVAPYALARPRPLAGRNEPCPCGSGRKYKACHLGKERHPLIDRGPWLYRKARRFLHEGPESALGDDLAYQVMHTAGGGAGRLRDLRRSALVDDLALCEGGVFDAFLAQRDALLPDDEALVAAQWALVPRSLFEIEHVRTDTLDLRDVRTGERVHITNALPETSTRPGMLMLGRPLPIDGTRRAFAGFVRIPDSLRDDALAALDDADPFEIAAVIGRSAAPPTMQNTSGHPLRFHELTYHLPDPDGASRALIAGSLRDDGEGFFTLTRDTPNMPDAIIVTIEIDGDTLRVQANSDARIREATTLVAGLVPEATLVGDDVRDLDEMMRDAPPPREATPPDPAMVAMLDEYVRERERAWLDQPIPALRGLTPREARDDPIGRDELVRLLRSFDDGPLGPGGFDPDRLRKLLDLE